MKKSCHADELIDTHLFMDESRHTDSWMNVCDTTHPYAWLDPFIRVTWLIHICSLELSVGGDSWMCVTQLVHMRVWHDSTIRMAWPMNVCDTAHPYEWHDSIIRVTWLIHICSLELSVGDDSWMCVTQLICISMTWFFHAVCRDSLICVMSHLTYESFDICHESFDICYVFKWLMTHIGIQPIPLGVSFSKAQSSKLERLFFHVSVKRDVRALSFELWNSIRKCHPKWDRLYHVFEWLVTHICHESFDIWVIWHILICVMSHLTYESFDIYWYVSWVIWHMSHMICFQMTHDTYRYVSWVMHTYMYIYIYVCIYIYTPIISQMTHDMCHESFDIYYTYIHIYIYRLICVIDMCHESFTIYYVLLRDHISNAPHECFSKVKIIGLFCRI